MQTIRAAAISINSPLGDVDGVLSAVETWTGSAAEEGAELILFPELQIHGHCTPNTWELAEQIPEGPSTQRIVELAGRFKAYISIGLSEKENDLVYNTQVLVGPESPLVAKAHGAQADFGNPEPGLAQHSVAQLRHRGES